jgi:predicted PurR-regulated permease PerM
LFAGSLALLQEKFADSREKLAGQAARLLMLVDRWLGVDAERQQALVERWSENFLQEIFPLMRQALYFSTNTLAMALVIPIFMALILYYREMLVRFVLVAVPERQVRGFRATIRAIKSTFFRFAKGMALVYLLVGLLNSVGFLLLGLPHAVYFGIMAALLTFFPYVGILVGGLAAVIVAWTTFDSVWYPMGVVAILGLVQYLEANVIFPLAVGHQLRINPLATFVAILLGGIIWGGAGMVLFVPFAAILKILADEVDDLAPLALLLGEPTADPTEKTGRET